MCLVPPSAMGFQTLIYIAYKYGSDFDIAFNPIKSMCMVTKPSKLHLKGPTSIYILISHLRVYCPGTYILFNNPSLYNSQVVILYLCFICLWAVGLK